MAGVISPELSSEEFSLLTGLVYRFTGIQMNESKKALLVNRLSKQLYAKKISSYREYYQFLVDRKEGDPEIESFVDSVTTNETFFFRASSLWSYFQDTFLPQWFKNNSSGALKIWCAAASSGEEPYTIAILCTEFERTHPGFSWSLQASDISLEMLEKCREGHYSGRSIERIDPLYLKRYFEGDVEKGVTVKKEIRRNIKFFQHKLQKSPPEKNFDIIFLRNVLIYFDIPTKELILGHAYQALKPGGTLAVGESEGLINVQSPFKYVIPSIFTKEL